MLSLVVLASQVTAARADAAAPAEAEDLIRQGVELRRKGDDQQALQCFENAYRIDPSPRAMAQIGLAEQAIGQWVRAYEHLHRALESASDPWIKKSHRALTEALGYVDGHVGQLQIIGGSPGAEVRINGVPHGALPLNQAIAVATGSVTIELAAPGLVPVQRITVVRAGEIIREAFDALPPIAAQPATTGAPTRAESPAAAAPSADAGVSAASRPTQVETAGSGSRLRPAAKWIAWGAGAVALGVGAFGWVQQDKAGQDFADGCGVNAGQIAVKPGSSRTLTDCQALNRSIDSNYRVEVIGFVAAGALAATGLVLWLTEPEAQPGESSAALSCGGSLSKAARPDLMCVLRWRF